ncbi:hypothetical protein ACT048_20600 [Ectopseudomonas khazarica]|uniref:hypothetical protein n=1 Tax=Ectopseudomonas khazarica TaxID=2502979 RepID=UPI0040331E76
MTKLREDRRRKAQGTHLTAEIKLRVCDDDHAELIEAARLSHAENLTGYARDCMFIGHRLQQGGQREQILAALVMQQQAHVLAALFRGDKLDPDQLSVLLADMARPLAGSVGDAKRA